MLNNYKDVVGFEGLYMISDGGEILSCKSSKILKPQKVGNGYAGVSLYKNGKQHSVRVHKLMAKTFLGESSMTVNHKDGDKFNNALSNLEYMSIGDNVRHYWDTAGAKRSHSVVMLSNSLEVLNIFKSIREAARESGAWYSCIVGAINDSSKTAGGFKWMRL